MLPAEIDVDELTRTVFEVVAGRVATRTRGAFIDAPVAYAVDVCGAWSGSVHFEIGARLASQVAASMFEGDALSAEDVTDAMCELANVIGGNVKGLLPGPSTLSIPRPLARTSLAPEDRRHLFVCEGEPFSVTVRPSSTEPCEP